MMDYFDLMNYKFYYLYQLMYSFLIQIIYHHHFLNIFLSAENLCLIVFALIGPITLPAGGIQNNLKELIIVNKSKEIILTSNCSLYTFPQINAKKLMILTSGSSLSILNKWAGNNDRKEIWARVELSTNKLIENPSKIYRGWIKM